MLRFVWDSRKARQNTAKHRVTFEEAVTVFGDPAALDIDDPAHSQDEARYVILGHSQAGRLIVAAYAEPAEGTIRLISARAATPRERKQYEEQS